MSEQEKCPKCGAGMKTILPLVYGCGSAQSYGLEDIGVEDEFFATDLCYTRQQARAEIAERLRGAKRTIGVKTKNGSGFEFYYDGNIVRSLIVELEGLKR